MSKTPEPFEIHISPVDVSIMNEMMSVLDHRPIDHALNAMIAIPILIARQFTACGANDLAEMIIANWNHVGREIVMLDVEGTAFDDDASRH